MIQLMCWNHKIVNERNRLEMSDSTKSAIEEAAASAGFTIEWGDGWWRTEHSDPHGWASGSSAKELLGFISGWKAAQEFVLHKAESLRRHQDAMAALKRALQRSSEIGTRFVYSSKLEEIVQMAAFTQAEPGRTEEGDS
jgi:hypothetical protein